jgi:hypothetical protein
MTEAIAIEHQRFGEITNRKTHAINFADQGSRHLVGQSLRWGLMLELGGTLLFNCRVMSGIHA